MVGTQLSEKNTASIALCVEAAALEASWIDWKLKVLRQKTTTLGRRGKSVENLVFVGVGNLLGLVQLLGALDC